MKAKACSIVLLFVILSGRGYSQIQKGSFLLSGKTDLNFLFSNTETGTDSITTNETRSSQFGVTVAAGYFVVDNLSVIISGAYSYAYNRTEPFGYNPGSETITTVLGVIPQLSYYFPLDGKLKPSLSIGVGYLFLRERDSKVTDNNNLVYSLKGPSLNGAAGLSYFITQSVALDLGIQYSHNRLKDKVRIDQIKKQNIVAGILGVTVFFLK
jgi:outer membrane protein